MDKFKLIESGKDSMNLHVPYLSPASVVINSWPLLLHLYPQPTLPQIILSVNFIDKLRTYFLTLFCPVQGIDLSFFSGEL